MKKGMANMLGVQGWMVYKVETGTDEAHVYVGRPKKEARCPHCGGVTRRVHSCSKTWRKVFHGTVLGRKVFLRLWPRRFYCASCEKAFTETFPGIEKGPRRPIQKEDEILPHRMGTSLHQAAKRNGVGDGVVRRVLKRRVMGEVPIAVALEGLSQVVLGIDEHSFQGQKMMITVTSLAPVRRLLAILPDDRLATLKRYLGSIPEEVKARIIGVCIDMKKAWRLELERQLPYATVVDRFHGIQDANRRVEEARKVEKEVTRHSIPRWPLLKNQEELTPRQAQALRWIYENHAHFHTVKEELRAVYEAKDRQEAAALLDRIIFNTQDASDVAMMQWGRTLKAWREAILAFHDLRITHAFREGKSWPSCRLYPTPPHFMSQYRLAIPYRDKIFKVVTVT